MKTPEKETLVPCLALRNRLWKQVFTNQFRILEIIQRKVGKNPLSNVVDTIINQLSKRVTCILRVRERLV